MSLLPSKIMQKVFNVFSTVAFLGVVTIAAGVGYVAVNRESIIDRVKAQVTEQVTEAVTGALGGALGGSLTEIPSGGALDTPGIPSLPF